VTKEIRHFFFQVVTDLRKLWSNKMPPKRVKSPTTTSSGGPPQRRPRTRQDTTQAVTGKWLFLKLGVMFPFITINLTLH
jgi:hypothetical protein